MLHDIIIYSGHCDRHAYSHADARRFAENTSVNPWQNTKEKQFVCSCVSSKIQFVQFVLKKDQPEYS
jgi:hypothetical protein